MRTFHRPDYTEVEYGVTLPTRRRRRRRLVALGILAVVGIVLASAWAVSIVTTDPGTSTASAATVILGVDPPSDTSALSARITNVGADLSLPINFTGRWGTIPADADDGGDLDPATGGDYELFQIDLGNLAATRTFLVELGINNTPDDFRALQFEFVLVTGSCADADLDNTGATGYAAQTLYVESSDSAIVFADLAGGGESTAKLLCIGVADTAGDDNRANDGDGTFLRREVGDPATVPPDPMPAFFAVLAEHS